MEIQLESEIGPLRTVVVHTPGSEIESVTPASAEELLYNDVIPLDDVQQEHTQLMAVLNRVSAVVQSTDLLRQAVVTSEQRRELALSLMRPEVRQRADSGWLRELSELSPEAFLQAAIQGVPNRRASFADFLSRRRYDIPALPNWYFMRDAAMAYHRGIVIGAMAYPVRRNEALLARAMLAPYSPVIWDGSCARDPEISLEGGDFLVARRDLLVVGLSERTSAAGLDQLLTALQQYRTEAGLDIPFEVIAVQLPHERTCIHLDMAVTQLDLDCMLVYEPLILGRRRAPVVRCQVVPGKPPRIFYADSLPAALAAAGMPVQTVACGGVDPVVAEREQWLAGTNMFSYGPGKAIGYDCNRATLEELDRAGFEIVRADDVLSGVSDPLAPGRRIIAVSGTELARGGGGVRCMTLPLYRDPVD
ncbi:arginine deiminase family protein [Spirochaeta africana]|uniref:arginine deiminase n=1 Tax=Spirochaeta africana (strain ATCC 700263 / DSM 8902 / Z-7692) TaxID=889378 RepID=H9UIC9_SPIAZ|nr:arginine deiminase family protein [Spirochaeta africana]AFG37272.1 arginine deiminase [Spirochaeta africana DSM 8902]